MKRIQRHYIKSTHGDTSYVSKYLMLTKEMHQENGEKNNLQRET